MRHHRRVSTGRIVVAIVVVSGLVFAACQAGTSGDTAPTATEHVDSTTTVPETTMLPATTTSTAAESDAGPFPVGEPVDLLVMTDSSGWGLAELYGPLAAEALDREVRTNDKARGGMRLTEILAWIRSTGDDDVAESEIIVVYGFPGGLAYALPEPSILSCFEAVDAALWPEDYTGDWTPGTPWEPTPTVATVEDWQPYRHVFDLVFEEIWRLRDGQPTIILTYDVPIGYIGAWRELGIESECTANMEIQSKVIREAAEANGVGFVSVFDVFHGPSHDEDPVEKGWMAEDLIHANDEGHAIIAQLLASHGFEPNEPPKAAGAPREVFDFSEHSMCDWFTTDEIARIVAHAQRASEVEMDFGENWECTTDGWMSSQAEVELKPYPGSPAIGDFGSNDTLDPSITYSGLDETHVWSMEGVHAVLRIEGHDDVSFRYVADPGAVSQGIREKVLLGFEIANAMLREMGWLG